MTKGGESMKLSVGIGLTNACNLSCAHCYRDTQCIDYISLEQIKTICENLSVGSMGFGTGENALHPEFVPIIEYLHAQGVKLSLASNGYSLMALSDEHLQMFNDLEVSIDFPTQKEQDAFRGQGNWALVHQAMERCRALNVPVSVLATLMSINFDKMGALADMAGAQGAKLRVNAYQSVKTNSFKLSYEQFWEGYRRLFNAAPVVSCTEPVVRAVMGLDDVCSPCGHTSIRFNPRGQIIPCVYWPVNGCEPTIADLPHLGLDAMNGAEFQRARTMPLVAADCPCRGGCAARRALNGGLDDHDEYCPWVRGDEIHLNWQPAPTMNLVRARNVCTTIVAP
jgi:MoaA/NifB/PqqE/SkfB family radical SAM enzyme